MLPCNVIVQETGAGGVEVAAIAPQVAMQSIENPQINAIAADVSAKLQRVINDLA